ncbi:MAG: DoxX family membrane protein [Bacteroidaceae bacterium]|nr:DoxX family membrane protein [Bacteroidaceae bacterium]
METTDKNRETGKTSKLLWIVVNTCRLLVSAIFVFSGLVKLIDPVGTQYKITDYAVAMNMGEWMPPLLSIILALTLAVVEFMIGINLFFGIRRRTTSLITLLFLLIYTPLTLWLAISNAVSDCGCFGDAVHLSNWQTFWKNVLLLTFAFVIWWRGNLMTRFISELAQWTISLFSTLYALFIAGLCLWGEPIIDFRPYYIGQNIPTAMEWPEDQLQQPEIMDFDIGSQTDAILSDTSYTFLLISPHIEDADDGNMNRINSLYDYARQYGYRFLCVTASGDEAIHRWQDLTGAEYPIDFADELLLKTIARSNPALLLLHDGTIIGKWGNNQIPPEQTWVAPLHSLPQGHSHPDSHHQMLLRLLLWYLVPLALFTFIDRFVFSLRWLLKRRRTAKNN